MQRCVVIKVIYVCAVISALSYGLVGCGKPEDVAENSTTPSSSASQQGTIRPGRTAVQPGGTNIGAPGMQPQTTPVPMRRATPGMMPPETGFQSPQSTPDVQAPPTTPGPLPPGQVRRAFPTLEQEDR